MAILNKTSGALKSNDNIAHGGQRYELDIPPQGSKIIKISNRL